MMKTKYIKLQAFLLALICCSGFSALMPLRIYMICIFLVLSISNNIRNTKLRICKNPLYIPTILFILTIVLGLCYSYNKTETFKYAVTFISGSTMILLPTNSRFHKYVFFYFEKFCKFIAVSIVVQLVIPNLYRDYLDVLIRGGSSAKARLSNELSQHIFSGILGEKGEAAFIMVIALILLLSKLVIKKKMEKKDSLWLVIYFVALLLPAKRMLFAIGVMIFMLYIIFWKKGSKKVMALGGAGLVGSLAYLIMSDIPAFNTLVSRFTSLGDDETGNGRIYLWEYAKIMFHEKPILGYGYGSYNKYASEKGVVLTAAKVWESHAHNIYYQLAAETGVVGIAIFTLLNVSAIYMFLKLYGKKHLINQQMIPELFVGINIIVMVLVYGLTGNIIYYTNQIMTYMWGFALLVYVYKNQNRNMGDI